MLSLSQQFKTKSANFLASPSGHSPANMSRMLSNFPLSSAHLTSLTATIAALAVKSLNSTIHNEYTSDSGVSSPVSRDSDQCTLDLLKPNLVKLVHNFNLENDHCFKQFINAKC